MRTETLYSGYRSGWDRGRTRGMTPEQRSEFYRQRNEKRDQVQREINQVTSKIVRDFESRLNHQMEMARLLTRISSIASYVYANTDIGSTGVRHEDRLVKSLRSYQRQFVQFVAERNAAGHGEEEEYEIRGLPTFDYRSDGLGERLDARVVDLLLLALFAVVFFMLAFVGFLRSDVQ